MRFRSFLPLLAALGALPYAHSATHAQSTPEASPAQPAAAPATAPVAPATSPVPAPAAPAVAPSPRAAAQGAHKASPHQHAPRPLDAPTPSMEDIARAFEPLPNGLTSDEIVRLALAHSPELRKAELAEDTARANKARAQIAFAPRFDFMGKFTHLSKLSISRPGQPDNLTPIQTEIGSYFQNMLTAFQPIRDQWYASAGITLPVTDIFLTIVPTYRGAAKLADIAMLRREASALEVSYNARNAFYNYAHVIGAVIVAQRAVQLYEANVHDLESLVQAGTATETDLMRARTELAKMKVHVVEFSGQVEVALARLATITGTEMDAGRGIGERFVGISMSATPEVAKLAKDAKLVRPEIAALRKLEEARKYLSNAKRGAQWPQLRGFWNGYYSNALPRVIPPQDKFRGAWDIGASIVYSPNDSVFANTQYKDSLTELASVREDLRLVEDGIDMEAAHAVTTHRAAVANTVAATEALESARRYQSDQRELMLAGAATPNDVLEAQLLLTRASLEWVDSFISVRLAEAALLKTQGKTGFSPQGPISRSTP